jgi:hypothetical protein
LKSNSKTYINAEIVLDYIETVVLPNLAELRTLDEFAEEIGVLLIDNLPSHLTDDLIHLLTEARARIITVAPHPTQIFQVLDVMILSALKRPPGY